LTTSGLIEGFDGPIVVSREFQSVQTGKLIIKEKIALFWYIYGRLLYNVKKEGR
jgi:hypothetical protein